MSDKNEFLRSSPGKATRNVVLDITGILLPVSLCVIGFIAMCQKFAAMVNWNPKYVGYPLYRLPFDFFNFKKGYPFYNPFDIFWMILAGPEHPELQYAFMPSVTYFVVFSIIGVVIFLIIGVLKTAKNSKDNLYGTARWADYDKDLKKFGLTMENGVVLAQKNDAKIKAKVNPENASISLRMKHNSSFVAHAGGTNTLGVAPTRSGKGVGFVIPTALSFSGSMIILDPKGEIYNITAGFRRKFSHVLKLSPVSDETVHYNPLADFKHDKTLGSYIDLITSVIFERGSSDSKDDFWANSASSYFNAVVAHVLTSQMYPEHQRNIPDILRIIKQSAAEKTKDEKGNETESGGETLLKEMLESKHFDDNGVAQDYLDRLIQGGANQMKSMNPKVRSDVFSTLFSKLGLFEDAYIVEMMSKSDFSLNDFYDAEHPISLYLTVPFGQMERVMPIFKVIINYILNYFSSSEIRLGSKEKKLKNRLLFLLDEFTSLGKQEQLMNNMAQLAGFKITFFIIIQDLVQLEKVYGDKHSFFANCKTVVIYAPGELATAQKISTIIGKESVVKQSISTSGNRFQLSMNNLNFSEQEIQRDLINPDELMKLPPTQCIIINQGMPPYVAKKNVYYDDPRFKFKAFSDHKVKATKIIKLHSPFDFELFKIKKGDVVFEFALPFLKTKIIPGFPAPYSLDEIWRECAALPSNNINKKTQGQNKSQFFAPVEALREDNSITVLPELQNYSTSDYLQTVVDEDSYGIPENNLITGDEPPPSVIDFDLMYFANKETA